MPDPVSRPPSLATKAKRLFARVRRRASNLRVVRWTWSDRYLLIFSIDAEDARSLSGEERIRCNQVEDLGYFRQTERWLPREVFIAEAQQRIAEGLRLYTAVSGTLLTHYSWLVPRQTEAWLPYIGQRYEFGEGAAVLFNAYTHPGARGSGLQTQSMRRRVADAASLPGTQRIFTAIESHNKASRKVAAKVGFKCVDVLFERSRFGRIDRGRMPPDRYFRKVEHSHSTDENRKAKRSV